MLKSSSRPFSSALTRDHAGDVVEHLLEVEVDALDVELGPASILEKSRMSLMIRSSDLAERVDLAGGSRAAWGSARSAAPGAVMPMIAFIGVRISWLMLARKSLLARRRLLRLLPGRDGVSLEQLEVGDVLRDTVHVRGPSILILDQVPHRMDPDDAAVHGTPVGIGCVVDRGPPLEGGLEALDVVPAASSSPSRTCSIQCASV